MTTVNTTTSEALRVLADAIRRTNQRHDEHSSPVEWGRTLAALLDRAAASQERGE